MIEQTKQNKKNNLYNSRKHLDNYEIEVIFVYSHITAELYLNAIY